jgi:two-component system, chemotaxis family, response regulator Rcp1
MSIDRIYKILVVDDNEGDLRLIQEAFSECGHSCHLTCMNSIPAAVERLQTERFDFVLSDMGPRGENLGLLRMIRRQDRLRTTPVIVLSGVPKASPAYEAGANAFVSKSIDLDTFFARIRGLMHFWVNVAELPTASTTNRSYAGGPDLP